MDGRPTTARAVRIAVQIVEMAIRAIVILPQ
jgi:hypothetical protein